MKTSNHHSYREIPTFGRNTIRKFSDNVSGLTKLAARDFEDLLQVSSIYLCVRLLVSEHISVRSQCSNVSFQSHSTQ